MPVQPPPGRFHGRLILVILATIILIPAFFSKGAAAYLLEGCKWPGYTIYWYTDTTGDYETQTTNSALAWSATPTRISTSFSTTNQWIIVHAVNNGNDGHPGITYYLCTPTGAFQQPTVSDYNTSYTDFYSSAEKQNVMVHELGHAIGLGHSGSAPPPCPQPIMYPNVSTYETCGENTPQQDDINGINALYP